MLLSVNSQRLTQRLLVKAARHFRGLCKSYHRRLYIIRTYMNSVAIYEIVRLPYTTVVELILMSLGLFLRFIILLPLWRKAGSKEVYNDWLRRALNRCCSPSFCKHYSSPDRRPDRSGAGEWDEHKHYSSMACRINEGSQEREGSCRGTRDQHIVG